MPDDTREAAPEESRELGDDEGDWPSHPRHVALPSLDRAQVEEALRSLGVLGVDEQLRPVTRADVEALAEMNGAAKGYGRPTCEGLDFSFFHFADHVDLSHMNFEYASFRGAHLGYVNFDDSSLLHANMSGAMMPRASCRRAWLHDANMDSVWANNLDAEDARLNRANLARMDLRDANLKGVAAGEAMFTGATMWRANCTDGEFWRADLRGADCWNVNFEGAKFSGAAMDNATLRGCNLKGATFGNVRQENGTYLMARIEDVQFAEATWGEEFVIPEEKQQLYVAAGAVYRSLKDVHQRAGMYDIADQFAFREQVSGRKQAFADRRRLAFLSSLVAESVFGYGYRWMRVAATSVVTFLTFTAIYWLGGLYGGRGWNALAESAYFSAVSFSGVGYGPWIPDFPSKLKYLGAIEAPFGISLLALLLLTFSRRFMR